MLEAWLEFGRGPLFRFSFALMVFGLLRILILTAISMWEAYDRNPDKILPWKDLTVRTFGWLIPLASLWRRRPIYSLVSVLFHVGMLLVPPFLAAHILLWSGATGIAWPALPQPAADWLTVLVIVTALCLLAGRLFHKAARSLSRRQDYMWPLLIMIPFLTGYVCANIETAPGTYQWMMLLHVWSANLIMMMLPFTKIAHCVLLPLSQYVTGLAWKFPLGAGQRVVETLGYGDRPTWVERPRLATDDVAAPTEEA